MFSPGINLSDAPLRVRVALTVIAGSGGEGAAIGSILKAIKSDSGDAPTSEQPRELSPEETIVRKEAFQVLKLYLSGENDYAGGDSLQEIGQAFHGPTLVLPTGEIVGLDEDEFKRVCEEIEGCQRRRMSVPGKTLYVSPGPAAL